MPIPRQHIPIRRRPGLPVPALLALAAIVAAHLASGCLPSRNTRTVAYSPAPAATGDPTAAEQARWAEQYRKNRPVPPTTYQVSPTPPRNNQFGEFDDALFQGIDRQAALPPLPADTMPGPAAMPASYTAPALVGPAAAAPYAAPIAHNAGMTSGFQRTAGVPMPPRPAGIMAEGHFYPVEQLVYGGDYPDLDKPERYRLMPKDVVTVTVRDHPEFSGQMEIQPDGTIRIPNALDPVRLRGLTVEEAAEAIRSGIAVYVRGECQVRVQANRARGGYYFVFGDVLQPGRFPMGMEAIKLSDAVLAANWEANPSRRDADGDELGPSFPAAAPRGKYIAPATADLARVMLITPHRSQPVRTVHDVRTAMLGVTSQDPAIRPGQIVVVPSLDPARNRDLGLGLATPNIPAPPGGKEAGRGFAGGEASARLPEVAPHPQVDVPTADSWSVSAVDANMTGAFDSNINTGPTRITRNTTVIDREPSVETVVYEPSASVSAPRASRRPGGWNKGF